MKFFNYNKCLLNNYRLNSTLKGYSTNTFTSAGKPSYMHYIGREPLVFRTIGQELSLTCKKYGDREAIKSCHELKSYTFNEIRYEADRLAAGLKHLGLKMGDRIGIWSPNTCNWYITMLAAARIGLISVGINPAFQIPEMLYCLKKVGVKAIIAPESFKTQKYYEMLNSISSASTDDLNNLLIVIESKSNLPGAHKLSDIKSIASEIDISHIELLQDSVLPNNPCNAQFSSGTTGQPKAAVLNHYNFINNGIHIGFRNELYRKHHKICVQNPFFHAFGVVITVMAALSYGATIILPGPIFNAKESLDAIVNEKCTVIHGTPTMYVDLVARQQELQYPIETPEIAVTGGAPCPPELYRNIKNVLRLKKVKTVYGLTENTAVVFQSLHDENEYQQCETIGHILDHTEVRVIDEQGKVVPMGTPGELCTRGYTTMLGYYNDEIQTNKVISKDGWLKTGDQFILYEDGYGKIVGRLKDMIIRGGENIFPIEIENYLNQHPDIVECYVFGVPDKRMGEEICASIKLGENCKHQLTAADIKEFCTGQIAHFKIPRYIRIVDKFPKTTSGKIQKFKLKEQFINEITESIVQTK